jgi:hypothetical protein
MGEEIVSAAVRATNGKVVRGRRHIDAIRYLQGLPGYEAESPSGEDQGFLTTLGRFVGREEAYRIHFPERSVPDELQSDDIC